MPSALAGVEEDRARSRTAGERCRNDASGGPDMSSSGRPDGASCAATAETVAATLYGGRPGTPFEVPMAEPVAAPAGGSRADDGATRWRPHARTMRAATDLSIPRAVMRVMGLMHLMQELPPRVWAVMAHMIASIVWARLVPKCRPHGRAMRAFTVASIPRTGYAACG